MNIKKKNAWLQAGSDAICSLAVCRLLQCLVGELGGVEENSFQFCFDNYLHWINHEHRNTLGAHIKPVKNSSFWSCSCYKRSEWKDIFKNRTVADWFANSVEDLLMKWSSKNSFWLHCILIFISIGSCTSQSLWDSLYYDDYYYNRVACIV